MSIARGWVKVCGITREADAEVAVESGASAIGINLWSRSPRSVTLARAVELVAAVRDSIQVVTVTVDADGDELTQILERLRPDWMQLHGRVDDVPDPARSYRAVGLAHSADVEVALAAPGGAVLVDARDDVQHGGTGRTAPEGLAQRVIRARPTILAGGLGPANVAGAVQRLNPHGVDAASGLESSPGIKDAELIREFVAEARRAWAEVSDV